MSYSLGENLQIKYPEDMVNKIIQGDCLKIMKEIPDNSVDAVITDPPYMISSSVKIRRQRNPVKFSKQWKFKGKDIDYSFGNWDIFESMTDYLKFTEQWFKECVRILRKGGHIISFFDKHKLAYLVHWAEELNVKTRQCLFWIKSNPVPQARKVSFMSAVEVCYWGTKETTERKFATFNYQLGQHPDYIVAPICLGKERYEFGFHSTQKPEVVLEWIIKYLTNEDDIVLDPFAGSGTTGAVCTKLNRRYILIEKEEKYCKIAEARIKAISGRLGLSYEKTN